MSEESPRCEMILYQTADGRARVECRFEDGTIWLTQKLIGALFDIGVGTVNHHLKELYDEGELNRAATVRSYRIVQSEGDRRVARDIEHYSLETILAVGYRVRSARGTQFRQWATATLSEYLVKGFAMDDERLRNPPGPGVPDYFDELLARIRDIRASERRMYLRVREILALAGDYQAGDGETTKFFQTVQNKLHFAVTGMTAAELIAKRADASKPNMGLTTWKAADRGGVVRRGDVTIAKNYLIEEEISQLNRIVVMFLDYAEDQAARRKQVYMADWKGKLDEFLRFNERGVLPDAGQVTRRNADETAGREYEQFSERRRAASEGQAEQESIRELEETVKRLPESPKKRKDGEP